MIEVKRVMDLTPMEWKACYRANYGDGGYMRYSLMDNRLNPDALAIMSWIGPHDTFKNMQGWALMTPVTTKGYLRVSRYTMKKAKYSVQFWVKRHYRRQGIATSLMNEVKRIDPQPHCFPHDKTSGEFLGKYTITTSMDDRRWLAKKPRVA